MLLGPKGQALDALTEAPGMELHVPQLCALLWSKLWFSSEKAAPLIPAALHVPILSCLAVPSGF